MILRYLEEIHLFKTFHKYYTANFVVTWLFFFFFSLVFKIQKGTIVEKLVEEVVKDGQHLRHLINICEGNVVN